jgi:imidazolonepropionase-like amidohydrolase
MAQQMFMMNVVSRGADSISRDKLRTLAVKMSTKGAVFCPTLHVLGSMEKMVLEQIRKEQNIDEVPAPMLEMIRKMTGAMTAVSRLCVEEMHAQGVRLLVGQDGCDPAATLEEMALLKQWGVAEAEIIRGATIYPAEWLGVDDRLGSIAPGKEADILIVDGDPLADIENIKSGFMVVHDGRIVKPRMTAGPQMSPQPRKAQK